TYYFVCTTVGVGPNPVSTAVDVCNPGPDASQVLTTCDRPAPTNYTDKAVAPCTEQPNTLNPATHITYGCRKEDTGFVAAKHADCLADTPQAGTGPAIYCHTDTTADERV